MHIFRQNEKAINVKWDGPIEEISVGISGPSRGQYHLGLSIATMTGNGGTYERGWSQFFHTFNYPLH